MTGDEAPTLNELVQEIAEIAEVKSPRFRLPVWPFWLAGAICEAICVPLRIEPPKVSLHDGISRTLDSYRQLGWV
jgi:nucleoside-diphosphate-sugar epimerase